VPYVATFHGVFLGLAKASLMRAARARRVRPVLGEGKVLIKRCNLHFRFGNWYRFRAVESIVVSQQQRGDTIRSCLLDPRRVHVVPNGISSQIFAPRDRAEARTELALPPGLTFLAVGRLVPEKGMHHAIRALAELDASSLLVIVGDGMERHRLEQLARELGVGERVMFTGAQPRHQVARYMNAADVFLFPTERNEAAPLVLPQALSSGLPVIASRIGGITEVIDKPGTNGLLIKPGDVDGLVRAMSMLASDTGLRDRLGHGGRRRALAEYTIERMTERTLGVYRIAQARVDGAPGRVPPKNSERKPEEAHVDSDSGTAAA
jgi:glycosyltransferase involved in cell wall biosynthesis